MTNHDELRENDFLYFLFCGRSKIQNLIAGITKGRVTRCNFSFNLQRNSTLKRCKLVTNVWYVKFGLYYICSICPAIFLAKCNRKMYLPTLHLSRVELCCKLQEKSYRLTEPWEAWLSFVDVNVSHLLGKNPNITTIPSKLFSTHFIQKQLIHKGKLRWSTTKLRKNFGHINFVRTVSLASAFVSHSENCQENIQTCLAGISP